MLAVGDDDVLARYILSSNHFSAENARVKRAAFMPPPDMRRSVFVRSGLTADAVWGMGQTHVAVPQAKTLHARADISVRDVKAELLNIDLKNEPPRHADIIGWHAEKSAWMLQAAGLAESSILYVNPSV